MLAEQDQDQGTMDPSMDEMRKGLEAKMGKQDQVIQQLQANAAEQTKSNLELGELMKIPAFRAVLDAHQKGIEIEVREKVEDKIDISGVDFDDLDPKAAFELQQKLLAVELGKAKDPRVDGMAKTLDEIKATLGQMTQRDQGAAKVALNAEVTEARAKYSDFADYVPAMTALDKETGQKLKVDELYKLVKSRSGGTQTNEDTGSTRPTSGTGKARSDRTKPVGSGRGGFKSLVNDALEGIDQGELEGQLDMEAVIKQSLADAQSG